MSYSCLMLRTKRSVHKQQQQQHKRFKARNTKLINRNILPQLAMSLCPCKGRKAG